MAKKSKSTKKHRFKHVEVSSPLKSTLPSATTGATAGPAMVDNGIPRVTSDAVVALQASNVAFFTTDLVKITTIIGSLAALELLLWVLFQFTSLDNSVYQLIKL
jgi:hypothetical protein